MAERASNMQRDVLVLNLEGLMEHIAETTYGRRIAACSDSEAYSVTLRTCKDLIAATERNFGERISYVISPAFDTEPMFHYNLRNMAVTDRIAAILAKNGKDLEKLIETEKVTSYKDNGAGRFCRSLIDMMAARGLEAEGLGLFRPDALFDKEVKPGISDDSWDVPARINLDMRFGGHSIRFIPRNVNVVGRENGRAKIRLFQSDAAGSREELAALLGLSEEADADMYFRIYQEYMLACGAVQIILYEMKARQYDLRKLSEHAVIQVHDAYPALVIPEMIRILVEEKAFTVDEAIETARKSCTFTYYHRADGAEETIPLRLLQETVPDVASIIRYLDRQVREKDKPEDVWIISGSGDIRMNALGMQCSARIRSAAELRANEALEEPLYDTFKEIYPEKIV